MLLPVLREYNKLYLCSKCGFCRFVCPVLFEREMEESSGPRGRITLSIGLLNGEVKPSARIAEKFYLCAGCRHCRSKCPPGIEIDEIIEAVRYEMVRKGIVLEEHKAVIASIREDGNPFGYAKAERLSGGNEALQKVLLWVGCVASYLERDIAKCVVEIFDRAKVDYHLLGTEEGCCGFPLFTMGYRDEFVEEARKNAEKIASKDVEKLVTPCPACYRTFKELYAQVGARLPIEISHISEFIGELIKDKRIEFRRLPLTVTYHDPCHLGRHMGLYDQPRDVILSIPGIKLVEIAKSKAEARCCGAGGALRLSFPALSTSIAATRIRLDVAPVKADALVTACPACVRNLKDGITKAEALYDVEKIEVLDLAQLVAQALK